MALGIDAVFGIHARSLLLRERRAALIASNLANSETPGYRARDLDFQAALRAESNTRPAAGSMLRTHAGHLPAATTGGAGATRYRVPDQPSLDGNTVNVHREQAEFMDNSIRYQASLSFLGSRIQSLRLALRGE